MPNPRSAAHPHRAPHPHRAISLRSVGLLSAKELADAWRNRWFLLFTATFTLLALGLSWLSMAGVSGTGFSGLGRTAASLMNLAVLIVPLMGLTLGAGAIAAERERGALLYLLAQPVSPAEVVLGKFLGLSGAVLAALAAGFGLAGLAIARRSGGGEVGAYLTFLALAVLLAMAAVALGLLVSALSRRGSVALGVALFLWFLLVFLGDLGVMGTSLVLEMQPGQLLAATLVNPLELFKVASTLVIRGGLEVLGPAGLYAVRTYGNGLLPMLVGWLALWAALPLAGSIWIVSRRGALP